MTAIPVGVGARAGDEGAGEVTATGAQTAVPGTTRRSPVNPDRHQHGAVSHFNLFTFSVFPSRGLMLNCGLTQRHFFSLNPKIPQGATQTRHHTHRYVQLFLRLESEIFRCNLNTAGLTTPPVAAPPDTGVTAGTAESHRHRKVWTLSKHEQLLFSLISN